MEGQRILVLGDRSFFDGIGGFLQRRNTLRYEKPRTIFSLARQIGWADLVWVEFAGKWINYTSRLEFPARLVCRLHGSDVYRESVIRTTNWQRVEHVFVVSEHLRQCFLAALKELGVPGPRSISVLYNGLDLTRYTFRERKAGFNIGVIASARFGKGYPMIVQIIKELSRIDRRFKVNIIGSPDEPDCLDTLRYDIRKWGIETNVQYEGHIPREQVPRWLDSKDYILSASFHEGHPIGLNEAMACGLKPVVYEYPGSREAFPDNLLFDTVTRAVELITSGQYDSTTYRDWVAEHFSSEKQCQIVDQELGAVLDRPSRRSRWELAIGTLRTASYRGADRLRTLFDN